ncbi:type II toxin-antitoxin system RelE/ParE family toxin [Pedobacter sp. SL55]|uniref:type II toxin-antitoxin system RelE/ParE family toxin n=1 Tax=Pedobacter sp. SL55 TaxID=2995161 RepID=UPI0022715A76|nr:type II toxin-antitoxin system RelE/ParE family toxin [Pedobacter sp. SL55]WAC40526.1 type II toxin-antitoxin system RelE/ParE family toxin [Pedobacter sp. SL55]
MANYLFTNKAVEDLTEIWYCTYYSWSEKQADKYYELLIYTFNQIAEKPEIGKKYDGIGDAILGVNIGKHIIFYHETKPDSIEIIRILHEQMDYKNRLKEK